MDNEKESDDGIWRDIKGADNNPELKMITLLLSCGHKVKIRTDTGSFWKSFKETELKACQCHQCNGTEYIEKFY